MSDQLHDEILHFHILSHRVDLIGRVWDICDDDIAYGDAILSRQYLDHRGAVAVLALDSKDRVLLLRQYRHPICAREWELPAGIMDIPGELAVNAARRELTEEAGISAKNWHLLLDFYPSPGGSNEAIRVFLARDIEEAPSDFVLTDEEADIERHWIPLDEVVGAVLQRRIQNGTLGIAVLAAVAARAQGWLTLHDPESPWDRHPANLSSAPRSEAPNSVA